MALAAREWAYAASETAPGGETIDKPGWIAAGPAALLELQLGVPVATHACITVVYLSSYTPDMGVALLDCAGCCACEPLELDAHAETQASLHLYQHVDVAHRAAESGNCSLRLQMKSEEGRGHKFKVLGLAAGAAGLSCEEQPHKTSHLTHLFDT